MTPTTLLQKLYDLPFPPHEYQEEVIDYLAPLERSGCYLSVGLGKTYVATMMALWHRTFGNSDQTIILMPPILLSQWARWLDQINERKHYTTETRINIEQDKLKVTKPTVTVYRGTKAERDKLPLDSDFILMSIQIFKNDYNKLTQHFVNKKLFIIVDEATAIRNPDTFNYKKVRDFAKAHKLTLLTGTAINSPLHCYAYIKLIAPSIYKSYKSFRDLHVSETDFFGNAIAFKNLDLLKRNMEVNSVYLQAEDVLDLPPIIYNPIRYDLEPKHKQLYDKLVEEQLLELGDGTVIDATTAQRLYHATQRIVLSPQAYTPNPFTPAGYDIVDTITDELDDEKLVIFSNYRLTNEGIHEYLTKKGLNPILCYGGTDNTKRVEQFLNDPSCKILVASPKSIGVGLNLQSVCRHILFMELPLTSNDFIQAVGRVYRQGQTRNILISIAVAIGTIQEYLQQQVVRKDDVIQHVMPSKQTLRKALYGQ